MMSGTLESLPSTVRTRCETLVAIHPVSAISLSGNAAMTHDVMP